ncbi:hypothetical protein HK096_003783, partial [Nowakowskiella sp. JEL0078]
MLIISFTLLGIEYIGREIENPFGNDENDLPLEIFCEIIESDVKFYIERIGLRPDPTKPG